MIGELTMPKKSNSKTKKLDSAIIVALIALAGTLITALLSSPVIVAWIQKTPALSNQTGLPTVPDDSNVTAELSPVTAGIDDDCLVLLFTDVEKEDQVSIEVGASLQDFYFSRQKFSSQEFLGPFGIQLSQNGRMIAAFSYLYFEGSGVFKLISIVDSNCEPISDYSSASGSDPNSIANYNDLQIELPEGTYILNLEFSGSDFFRFTFRQLQ